VEVARLVSVRAGQPASEHLLRLRGAGGTDIPVKLMARAATYEGGTAVILGLRKAPAAGS